MVPRAEMTSRGSSSLRSVALSTLTCHPSVGTESPVEGLYRRPYKDLHTSKQNRVLTANTVQLTVNVPSSVPLTLVQIDGSFTQV